MRWPLVTAKRRDREVAAVRRRLIEHLRADSRGLVVLDNVMFQDVTMPGPICVLGDNVTLTGSVVVTGAGEGQ